MPWSVSPLFAQAAAVPGPSHSTRTCNVLVALAVIVVSFFLGGYLGRKLRMPDHGWKIGLCLFTLFASVAILLLGPPLKLGIDLRGGACSSTRWTRPRKEDERDGRHGQPGLAIIRRVNPGGQKEVTVRKYGTEGIEIIVPEQDEAEVERIEHIISQTGEFRIPHAGRQSRSQGDAKGIIERAMADPSKMKVTDRQGNLLAWWVPVKPARKRSFAAAATLASPAAPGNRAGRDHGNPRPQRHLQRHGGLSDVGPARSRPPRKPCVNFNFNTAGGQLFGR